MDGTIASKSSLVRNKRYVENVGIEKLHVPQKHYLSQKNSQSKYLHPIQDPEHEESFLWNKNEPYHKLPGANSKKDGMYLRAKYATNLCFLYY